MGVLFLLAVSLPPKWATLHLAGLLLALAMLLARREDWRGVATRTYGLYTGLWLGPVLIAALLQHLMNVGMPPSWPELFLLTLRILGIGFGIIVLVQRGWLRLGQAVFVLLTAMAFHALAGVVQMLSLPDFGITAWRQTRLYGLAGNPNPFGLFMALTTILTAGLLRRQPRRSALWVLLGIALLGVLGSASRGATLVVVLGMLLMFPPRTVRLGVFWLTAIGVLSIIYALSGAGPSAASSDNERMLALRFTLEKIQESPWLGWGVDAYGQLPGRVGPAAPHNMLLDLAVGSGLPVLAAWIVSTVAFATRLYRHKTRDSRLALILLVAATLGGILEHSLLVSTHYRGIWVVLTALACCTLTDRTQCESGVEPRSVSRKLAAKRMPDRMADEQPTNIEGGEP
ncbi:MAG: hypothetical protein LDL19_07645 [Thiobacillus sp.]|nr:hypothetical protein [Thiobacillus sp.]